MSLGAACGPSFGMGWDVESSGAGDGFPPGFWFLLGFRVGDGPVVVNIVHVFCFGQGVRVTQRARGGSRTAPTGEGLPHPLGNESVHAKGALTARPPFFIDMSLPRGEGEFLHGRVSFLGGIIHWGEGWIPARGRLRGTTKAWLRDPQRAIVKLTTRIEGLTLRLGGGLLLFLS